MSDIFVNDKVTWLHPQQSPPLVAWQSHPFKIVPQGSHLFSPDIRVVEKLPAPVVPGLQRGYRS